MKLSSTDERDPEILKAAQNQVKNRTYTLANNGRPLQQGETLLDVAYASIDNWRKLQTGFTVFNYQITLQRLKERTSSKGHLPKGFPDVKNPDKYKFIPSSIGTVVLLDGHQKQLGFRCAIPEELIAQLEETQAMLPRKKAKECRRGKYVSRHWALWGDCMKKVQPSKEYTRDLPHSKSWLEANQALWTYLSQLLRQLEPDMYRTATNFDYLLGQQGQQSNFAEAWSGMAINQEMTPEARSDWHFDWQDSNQVFNCLVPFGTFTGADLLLVLGHKVTAVKEGNRSVLDLLTHKSNFDDRMRNNPIHKQWKNDRKAKAQKLLKGKRKIYAEIDREKKIKKQRTAYQQVEADEEEVHSGNQELKGEGNEELEELDPDDIEEWEEEAANRQAS
ncbi:hypothetical protein FN846DRAFT_891826 [Sphaerosporella brunnea]|uniref:Uncharacterized protein n=1 Tax=Sphaerosporella brunnea TaxID=1250544 RepID=A0A5J5ERI3_9PEZI|nr:hypothetical protein FN846DRAFT_891826 [Sphaerosporella brunnea]